MYIESKSSMAGQAVSSSKLDEVVSKIEDAVRPVSQAKVFSIFHARAAVMTVAREYKEFRVWAGDMHGPQTFVVTIWEDWVGVGDKREHFVKIHLPKGRIVS
jgi:hypothetical protein